MSPTAASTGPAGPPQSVLAILSSPKLGGLRACLSLVPPTLSLALPLQGPCAHRPSSPISTTAGALVTFQENQPFHPGLRHPSTARGANHRPQISRVSHRSWLSLWHQHLFLRDWSRSDLQGRVHLGQSAGAEPHTCPPARPRPGTICLANSPDQSGTGLFTSSAKDTLASVHALPGHPRPAVPRGWSPVDRAGCREEALAQPRAGRAGREREHRAREEVRTHLER